MRKLLILFPLFWLLAACGTTAADDEVPAAGDAVLRFRFRFDPGQERLNNLGQPAALPAGHAALTPDFHYMSGHFIELVPTALTPYRGGALVYQGPEVPAGNPNPYGFTTAIDFDRAIVAEEDVVFLEVPVSELAPGTYRHLRISVAFQHYDVRFNLRNVPVIGALDDQAGTIASFVGYNTQINTLTVGERQLTVNAPKLQGFWAFETRFDGQYEPFNQLLSGQAPADATTVVNPFPESPIPPGSCVVSGSLDRPLTITGLETEDIDLTLSFSINGSFEWRDANGNGAWDLDVQQPERSEMVVDMGLRGLKVLVGR